MAGAGRRATDARRCSAPPPAWTWQSSGTGLREYSHALGIMGFEGMAPRLPLAPVSERGEAEIADALYRADLLERD